MSAKSLNGSTWVCIDETMSQKGMTCTVIDGEINPDDNGENDIEIKYEDDTIAYVKYRRFVDRFEQIGGWVEIKKPVPLIDWRHRNIIECPHCRTEQQEAIDDLIEAGDMDGEFRHDCEHCNKPFHIAFEYRPYIKTYAAESEDSSNN